MRAECIREVALHLDAGRQRAPPDGHLGDLAVRIEQESVHPVDHGVFDLQPEVRGVVRSALSDRAAEDKVVVWGRYAWTMRKTGRPVASEWLHMFTIRDGKLAGFDEFTDTAQFAEALRG